MTNEKIDAFDILLRDSLQPVHEPGEELNAKVIKNIKRLQDHSKNDVSDVSSIIKLSRNRIAISIPRIAAAVIILSLLCTGGVYAANFILNKVIVTDHGISVGNEDYIDDEEMAKPYEPVSEEDKGQTKPGAGDKWLSKNEVLTNSEFLNTYYEYPDYDTMVSDTRFENIFATVPAKTTNATYVTTDFGDGTMEYSIDVDIAYKDGTMHLYQDILEGNVAEDITFSVPVYQKENVRNYTTKSGLEFTLVDGKNQQGDESITTVMISYGKINGYMSFYNLSENEIHEVLELIDIKDQSTTETE
jgi:hypothetical protein